jgi:uncharacterized protein (TIGR03435 family)
LVVWCFRAHATSYPDGPEVGEAAPALKITQWLQAPPEAAMGWPTGKVVVLEFWATWCGPCVASIPHLNELAGQFKDQPVQFIAVTDDRESALRQFLKKTPINAWIGIGADAGFGEDKPYRVYAIPHTVIIDLHGRIAAVTDPRALTPGLIELCLADKPLPQANEPGGEKVPGVVPGQYRIGAKPLFQVLIRPPSRTNQIETWSASGLTFQPAMLKTAIEHVFNVEGTRIVAEVELPKEWYEFYITLPWTNGSPQGKDMLEAVFAPAVQATFGLTVKREVRDVDVLVLKTNSASLERLTASTNRNGQNSFGWGEVSGTGMTMSSLTEGLEHAVSMPVIDETGLTNRYSFDVKWDQKDRAPNPAGMMAAVREFGLDLVPAKKSLKMVVVRKAGNAAAQGENPGPQVNH